MKLSNQTARRVAIQRAGLSEAPTGPCNSEHLLGIIKKLGYVQLDPLRVVERAHDHILWSRCNQYRPRMLSKLMASRQVFEHFCHDACVLPMDTIPFWSDQFERMANKPYMRNVIRSPDNQALRKHILERIESEGELRSNDFSSEKKSQAAWTKPPHKQVLDYLWLSGELAVSKRVKFSKYYDLASRVYPHKPTQSSIESVKPCIDEREDWLCNNALKRLGFAVPGDIARFWEACELDRVKNWVSNNQSRLAACSVELASGETVDTLALGSDIEAIANPPEPTRRLRVINPFDPLVRDRKRLMRLFNFDFRIEIYTPKAKRQYGYYVYPLLEGDTFVGRLEVSHDRNDNVIQVSRLWSEPGIKFGTGRMTRLHSELDRLKRFCGAESINWQSTVDATV